ncbi:MAG: ferredoxin--nitrite reductase [Chloroflexi bacterium]|nr:MAG: ferredoxin--nitrite reductase [Chloroflexota bacterium]
MGMNKAEALKASRPPLSIIEDIYRWAEAGFDAIPPEQYDLFKWYGLFHRKQTPGYFMLRMRISNGLLSTRQLRTLAGISRDFGRGVGDFTTRQNIQLRWIEIENVPELFQRLHTVGLTSQQTGMDNYRNVTGCPVAGLSQDELLDGQQQAVATALSLLGPEFQNLPRKFNIAISGCRHDCAHARTNDIGLIPATRTIGKYTEIGFNVVVGGALGGTSPYLAEPLDVFVRPEEATPLCRAILTVFRDNGNRDKRHQGRLKWLLWEWGIERFREEVMKVYGAELPRAGQSALYPADEHSLASDHIGVYPQKQLGLNYVGMLVPVGRFTAEQLFELADLADRYGNGEVRLTNDQNVIIPNVPDEKIEALLAEPLLQTWSPFPSGIMRGLVTCTGKDYCYFALNDTKGIALAIAQALEKRFPDTDKVVRINVSGCVHACGRHRAGELGLQAQRVRLPNGEIVDGFDVFVGGSPHDGGQLGELTQKRITVEETIEALAAEIAVRYYPTAVVQE